MSNITELFPQKDTHPHLFDAWMGLVSYAINNRMDDYYAYLESKGEKVILGTTPFTQAIDKASGYDFEQVKNFMHWVNEYLWGEVE